MARLPRRTRSFRAVFRDFQHMRGGDPDGAFIADLEYLENRDLDLSIRQGAVLAFNALMVTIGTHPISASPGAPLSLDAATQPWETIASLVGIVPFIASSWFCLTALLLGEEPDPPAAPDGGGAERAAATRLFAAFVRSIDRQTTLLGRAIRCTVAGGVLTMLVWAWILAGKML